MIFSPTCRLYESQPFCAAFDAKVLFCAAQPSGLWGVVLDRTAFFPEGGGQPCDIGTLDGVAVRKVSMEETGCITHHTEEPLSPGATVHGVLDWPARWDHMQQHTGEHILSGTLHRLFGSENVGFHIGSPFVRMDLDRPLSAEQLATAEREANAVVQKDVAVRCWVPTPEELAALCYRSKKELSGSVRLVEIPGADLCACCGTHLASSGQVGLIHIVSAQHYKTGLRLAVACGARAVQAVQALQADALAAGNLLSAAPGALTPALERFFAAQSADHMRLAALQRSLGKILCSTAVPGRALAVLVDGADSDALRRLCLALSEKTSAPCAVFAPAEAGLSYGVWAPDDARPAARALNEAFGGRGGGKPGFCQGFLPYAGSLLSAEALFAAVRLYFEGDCSPASPSQDSGAGVHTPANRKQE